MKGNHFGRWLKREIENRLMTRKVFAEKAGVSVTIVHGWCHAKCPPLRGLSIVKIAAALEISRVEVEAHLGLHAAAA